MRELLSSNQVSGKVTADPIKTDAREEARRRNATAPIPTQLPALPEFVHGNSEPSFRRQKRA